MEKKDMMYLVAALVLVLVIALVIKPLATGQVIKTGMPEPTTTILTPLAIEQNETIQIPMMTTTLIPTDPPTPIPTWNQNLSKDVSFVDPSKYGVSFNQTISHGSRFNDTALDTNMTTIATIASSDGSSGTTNIMYIPFPYWELVYTVDPATPPEPETVEAEVASDTTLRPWGASPSSYSGISGSYSTVRPQFTIQVMDGDDPNRIVRSISPPGGINLDLWMGEWTAPEVTPETTSKKRKASLEDVYSDFEAVDPRPWTEKFYEGQRNYYFIVTAQSLNSYSIELKVPSRYIGKY
jgi:hypothetical protein